ncbi:MAG: hypothetical protein ISS35_01795 [Kiritimatiellae bacterium]|nr:hypothetical protein [Kiritimatiellia bacterium]
MSSDKQGFARRPFRSLLTESDESKGIFALLDQGVVSGTGFAVNILLARFASLDEYGAYVLAFSILLAIAGIQCALITDPLAYLYASQANDREADYSRGLLFSQLSLAAACLIVVGLVVGLLSALDVDNSLRTALMGLGSALLFLQMRELCRRLLFARFQVLTVLGLDLSYSFVVLLGLAFLLFSNRLSARSAFIVLACGGAAASAVGLYGLRDVFSGKGIWKPMRLAIVTNWPFARWHLIGMIGGFGYLQANTFVVAAILGTTSAAVLHASRNLLMPVEMLLVGAGNFVTPRASSYFTKDGQKALRVFVKRWGGILSAITAIYCGLVAIYPQLLLQLLYGAKYSDATTIVRLWAVAFMLFALRRAPSIGLVAMRRPDIIVKTGLLGFIVSLAVCIPTSATVGVSGAVLARIASEVGMLTVILTQYVTFKKDNSTPASPSII